MENSKNGPITLLVIIVAGLFVIGGIYIYKTQIFKPLSQNSLIQPETSDDVINEKNHYHTKTKKFIYSLITPLIITSEKKLNDSLTT